MYMATQHKLCGDASLTHPCHMYYVYGCGENLTRLVLCIWLALTCTMCQSLWSQDSEEAND
jgi:hypothetical protein